ncbi:hypothetical protein [Salsipaludibacter albus]|uniref:hypothetical protein n=1 Tax=Salsipaludibacter albus TaxID=2849650 RepID=UPI001EE491E1|nr:hypothetical protein [Salsipaludibacter albus]MBY5164062.1 hypothetical protein [Salsipaludibacter albus]
MIDQLSLFLHVLAAIGLVGGGIMQVMVGARLRRATTAADIARWGSFAQTAGVLMIVSAVVSLLTGGHLAGAVWTTDERSGFSYPFITLGMAALVVLAPVGPMLGGGRLRRIVERTHRRETAADLNALQADVRSSSVWGPVHSLVGVGVGLVWVMTAKPGWLATAVVLLGSFVLGWISGLLVSSRPRQSAARSTERRD